MAEREMHRVNVRISSSLNEWLDEEAKKTGLTKTAIMMMATEDYRKTKEAMTMFADIGQLVAVIENSNRNLDNRLHELEKALKRNERN